jgi:xylulokinase
MGTALRPAILYGIDTRATAQIDQLIEDLGGTDAIMAQGGSTLSTQTVGPKLVWLSDEKPEIFDHARWLFMPHTWLGWRLTGTYYLDHHLASQCTPMPDNDAQSWYEPWVSHIAHRLHLPPLVWPGEVVGSVTTTAAAATGLKAGHP